MQNVRLLAESAKEASRKLGLLSTQAKNQILEKIADVLTEGIPKILAANNKDMANGKVKGLTDGLLDRLLLTEQRLQSSISDIRKTIELRDHVGTVIESRELANGLFIKRVRVPLGVVAMIYEARPNVTIDATVLCLKSGNAVILKGGSDAMHSNSAIVEIIKYALDEMSSLSSSSSLRDAVSLIGTTDRNDTLELLNLDELVDVIIPRGSKKLIEFVRENSRVPVIETGASVVHIYVDRKADIQKAVKIVLNAKLRRVSICNALDSLLVHKDIAKDFLAAFAKEIPLNSYGASSLKILADAESAKILNSQNNTSDFNLVVKKSTDADYDTEFLDYILAIKTVKDLDEALHHIEKHSLKHSEAIITEDQAAAMRFLNEVDAACVYLNASTQFSDGGQFGLGAEIGISTQKLHVRGPFALEGLTSYKWVIEGNGQIRTP